MGERERAEGQRLITRADRVLSVMHVVCRWNGVACALAMGVLIAALAGDDRRLAITALLSSLIVQVAHIALHIAAHVVRRQLTAFLDRWDVVRPPEL